jgi:hypothetical protein
MNIRKFLLPALLGGAVLASGCSTVGAKPWQRGMLAREDMAIGHSSVDEAIDEHLYFSKEASSGGRGFAGGGCGCN